MPITLEGTAEVLDLLQTTVSQTKKICGRTVYVGAEIVADECKKRLMALETDDSIHKGRTGKRRGPSKRQKAALIESMGIASIRYNAGVYDVKLGFDGYNDIVTERWPKGQPNAMIARSVNKGTSFMEAQPFMDLSVESKKDVAEKAMTEEFSKQVEKLWEKI